jgi:hypothetical protein
MSEAKRMKKFVTNTMASGMMMGVGSVAMSKVGGMGGNKDVEAAGQSALSIGSTGMIVGGAGYAMGSINSLGKSSKSKHKSGARSIM